MTLPTIDFWALFVSLCGGLALFLAFRLVHRAVPLFVLSARRVRTAQNVVPVVELASWVLYLLVSAAWILEWGAGASLGLFTVFFLVILAVLYPTIQNVVVGLVMRGDGVGRLGDEMTVGNVRGVVVRRGLRSLTFEPAGGDQVVLPWLALRSAEVVVHGRRTAVRVRRFEVDLPPHVGVEAARHQVAELVLHNHWTVPAHEPRTEPVAPDRLIVTVHGLSDAHLTELERQLRAHFAALAAKPADGEPAASAPQAPQAPQAP